MRIKKILEQFKYISSLVVDQICLLVLVSLEGDKVLNVIYISPVVVKFGIVVIFSSAIYKTYVIAKQNTKKKYINSHLKEKEKLIVKLKKQKYEFCDHLQTIRGLIKLRNDKKVKKYLEVLNQKLR